VLVHSAFLLTAQQYPQVLKRHQSAEPSPVGHQNPKTIYPKRTQPTSAIQTSNTRPAARYILSFH